MYYFEQWTPCFFTTVPRNLDTCFIINSMHAFGEAFECDMIIPYIDFENYTLIIGKHKISSIGCYVKEQKIVENSCLTLLTTIYPHGSLPSGGTCYYWGIYPKLPKKQLYVEHYNDWK